MLDPSGAIVATVSFAYHDATVFVAVSATRVTVTVWFFFRVFAHVAIAATTTNNVNFFCDRRIVFCCGTFVERQRLYILFCGITMIAEH